MSKIFREVRAVLEETKKRPDLDLVMDVKQEFTDIGPPGTTGLYRCGVVLGTQYSFSEKTTAFMAPETLKQEMVANTIRALKHEVYGELIEVFNRLEQHVMEQIGGVPNHEVRSAFRDARVLMGLS